MRVGDGGWYFLLYSLDVLLKRLYLLPDSYNVLSLQQRGKYKC